MEYTKSISRKNETVVTTDFVINKEFDITNSFVIISSTWEKHIGKYRGNSYYYCVRNRIANSTFFTPTTESEITNVLLFVFLFVCLFFK